MPPDTPLPADLKPEWRVTDGLVAYGDAVAEMEAWAAAIAAGEARPLVWLLEHPPLYTAGTSADPKDLKTPDRFPVFKTGRGGQYTYHGPGQRVVYVLMDLTPRGRDIRRFVFELEEWVIQTLSKFTIKGERRDGRVGIWVARGPKDAVHYREDKIAAIGVRVRKWVTFHGLSINVEPDLSHFEGIVPCGIEEHGVTSLWDLGVTAEMTDVDLALRATFPAVFGMTPR